jgi:hypothetical protein
VEFIIIFEEIYRIQEMRNHEINKNILLLLYSSGFVLCFWSDDGVEAEVVVEVGLVVVDSSMQ